MVPPKVRNIPSLVTKYARCFSTFSNLSYLNEQEKLQKPAFYILIGKDEATKPQAYIGETENFKERGKDHDSKKIFCKTLVFVSKD